MSRDDWREMTDYLLGCDPSEPDIFKGPTTMSKEQFEAHVRAEATKKHVLTADLSGIEYAKMMGRREAYIAARMDHEWKLVAVIQQAYEAIDSLNDGGFGPLTSVEGVRAMSACIEALSPYTTKPIE